MKTSNKDLKKAGKMVRARKYPQAIRFLEPKVPLFLEDEFFYFLLGKSCYHTADIGGAEFYFKRSLQVNSRNIDSRLYLAAIQLKKKDQANAARLWLNILDHDDRNRYARKGLDKLKSISSPAELDAFIGSREINRLVPPMKGLPLWLKNSLLFAFFFLCVSAAAYFAYPLLKPEKNPRQMMGNLSLENYIGPYLEIGGDYIYEMTGDEIRDLFESAVDDFHNYDDNSLQMKINKLKLSNASGELKSKLDVLEGMIQPPTFLTLKTSYSYREIAKDPLLFEKCYVLWTGRMTNIDYGTEKISLDFLVGYEDETVLEGIVFAEIPFETALNQSLPMEILGQIRYRNGKIVLTAVSLRAIIK